MKTLNIPVYIDFKSPYAYLAIKPVRAMALAYDLIIDWRPYNLTIAEFLGTVELRNEHQWRRVRYSYMDVRRLANQRDMTILGPRKLFDSTIASIGLLYARQEDVTDPYVDTVFEQFFRRSLDIEDADAIASVIAGCGADGDGFSDFLTGPGRTAFEALVADAERHGVFGVPSFLFENELFWGNERLGLLAERIRAHRLAGTTAR